MKIRKHNQQGIRSIPKLIRRLILAFTFRRADFTRSSNLDQLPGKARSVWIRVVDCGSGNAAEQEILAMFNPVYDAERFGIHLVASPRHADILLLTGPLTRNMEAALLATFEAMPEPRRVVTVGDDILGLGVFCDSYAVVPLPAQIAAASLAHIPGDSPTPEEILKTLLDLKIS